MCVHISNLPVIFIHMMFEYQSCSSVGYIFGKHIKNKYKPPYISSMKDAACFMGECVPLG